ncbi:MAG: SIMPL domain-containing protein [Leptolyngbyaceae cyanobacterium CSU_1_4]|nr:SIMPL domain-containing protein [Leptolyngbyaceae cyanobacterium CSU_1_4]
MGYFTNNCAALETEARRLAMADARSRSSALAETAGITLGRLTALTESATFGYYGGTGCPSAADNQGLQDPYALQGVDLLSPAVVRVNSSVSATYEMK